VEGCCLFVTYQWGNPQAPIYRGNAEGAKLPHGYVAEKTNPGALELKKSPSSLDQEGLCKGLDVIKNIFKHFGLRALQNSYFSKERRHFFNSLGGGGSASRRLPVTSEKSTLSIRRKKWSGFEKL
jgi:hypothetical protein